MDPANTPIQEVTRTVLLADLKNEDCHWGVVSRARQMRCVVNAPDALNTSFCPWCMYVFCVLWGDEFE